MWVGTWLLVKFGCWVALAVASDVEGENSGPP